MTKTTLGDPVKVISLFLLAISLTALAQDDLGRESGKRCDSTNVKQQIGSTGSCRIMFVPKKFNQKLVCTGLAGKVSCVTSFDPEKDESLNLSCDGAEKTDFSLPALGHSHNIVTLIKKADGQDSLMIDETEVVLISSEMVNIKLEVNGDIKSASVEISSDDGFSNSLKKVRCQF